MWINTVDNSNCEFLNWFCIESTSKMQGHICLQSPSERLSGCRGMQKIQLSLRLTSLCAQGCWWNSSRLWSIKPPFSYMLVKTATLLWSPRALMGKSLYQEEGTNQIASRHMLSRFYGDHWRCGPSCYTLDRAPRVKWPPKNILTNVSTWLFPFCYFSCFSHVAD